jgi:hypothetical protein
LRLPTAEERGWKSTKPSRFSVATAARSAKVSEIGTFTMPRVPKRS